MEKGWEGSANYRLPNANAKSPSEPKRKKCQLVGNEERSLLAHQCCQRSNFLAKSSDLSLFVKRLATNLATFSGVFGFSAILETNVKARIVLLP